MLYLRSMCWLMLALGCVQAMADDKAVRTSLGPPGTSFKDCPECPDLVVLPPGRFMMGSPDAEAGRQGHEGPQHAVQLARPLAVGKFEVTFAEWDACLADGGCGKWRPDDNGWGRERRPVMNVSWGDAYLYTRWLSKKTGKAYRLLSESEREYAARAGSTSSFYWGSEVDTAYVKHGTSQTLPVGSTRPNAFGLYDMSGNVDEWTDDCYHPGYDGAPANGLPWSTGNCSVRVTRGGAFFNFVPYLRSASRYGNPAGLRANVLGFRVATDGTPTDGRSDGQAEHSMALLYDKGDGVPVDRAQAVRWYRLAAEAGHVAAQVGLGWDYMNGQGVSQNYAESARFFRMAALLGDAEAQSKMGYFHKNGLGVAKDMAEAVKWFRLAAAQGVTRSASYLGSMLARGDGVPVDTAEGMKWLRVAADAGDADARKELKGFSTDLGSDMQAATEALARKDFVAAIGHATRVINAASQDDKDLRVRALSARGNAFYNNRRYELAVPDLEAALKLDPSAASARSTLAALRSDVATAEKARKDQQEREAQLEANRQAASAAPSGSPPPAGWQKPDYMIRAEQARKAQNAANCERASKGANVYCQRN